MRYNQRCQILKGDKLKGDKFQHKPPHLTGQAEVQFL